MAYATVEELAALVRIQVTPKTSDWLDACLSASAEEIDHWLDRAADDPLTDPPPVLVHTTNLARAVEWYKANDAAFGAIGFADTGVLRAPADAFTRHAATLIPHKTRFGIA